jgi:putative redox protein
MEVSVAWQGEARSEADSSMRFVATTGSGHQLEMDGAPAAPGHIPGGNNLAARPMEVVLAGTGGCTAYDVVMILRRAREKIVGCDVRLIAERASEDPKVFTAIHFHFIVTGESLAPDKVERAIHLSHSKYCSASIMLAKTAVLTHSFEIVEASAASAHGAKAR